MEKINYPLLYFELSQDAILGILVGTDYQVVDRDLRRIKSTLSDHLQKQYKKTETYPFMDITDARLKTIEVSIRPAYKDNTGSYPFSHTLNVPVPVVFGPTAQGYYECHLPLFEESFYYYDPKQFDALVQHFVTNVLTQFPPEKIYQLLVYKKPKLDKNHPKE